MTPRVTMRLADAAQALGGKLYILGGGWNVTGPMPVPSAIALYIEVPWDETNRRHKIELSLVTADDQPIRVAPAPGQPEQALQLTGEFEVGRPPGVTPGSPISAALAIGIGPIPLPPGGRYVWRLSIDGRTNEEWQLTFSTRPAQPDFGGMGIGLNP